MMVHDGNCSFLERVQDGVVQFDQRLVLPKRRVGSRVQAHFLADDLNCEAEIESNGGGEQVTKSLMIAYA